MGGGERAEVIDDVPEFPELPVDPEDPGNKNPGDGKEKGKRFPGNENLLAVVVSFSCLSTSARSSTGSWFSSAAVT